MKPRKLVFLATDECGKTKKSDRRAIRSQCMNGKNIRIGLNLSRTTNDDPVQQPTNRVSGGAPFPPRITRRSPSMNGNEMDIHSRDVPETFNLLAIPRAPSSDLVLLADTTDASARLHISHCRLHYSSLHLPYRILGLVG